MTIQEKYFETEERLFDDKIEVFMIRGKRNDYRVLKTTIGAYDENDQECIGWGADIEISEARERRDDIMEYIKREYEDEYDFTEDTFDGIMIDGEMVHGDFHSINTQLYSSPDDADDFVNDVLALLEKIA